MTERLHRFTDSDAAARALAGAIAADLRAALASRDRALLLVSGGRSPTLLFDRLAEQAIDWPRVDVSLVDERSVAPDAEAANALLVRRHLMVGPAQAAGWIALMPPELLARAASPFAAAEEAARTACSNAALAVADVIVLGLGNDGHTASLFVDAPQWQLARTTAARYVALQPRQAPHARVGLSLRALREQQRCYLWATGAEKIATLETLGQLVEALQGAPGAPDAASLMAQAGPVACLIADPNVMLEVYCSEVG